MYDLLTDYDDEDIDFDPPPRKCAPLSCDDLHAVIGQECANHPDYTSDYYWLWEQDVATPLLREKGWVVVRWCDGERDRFGPLTRIAVCLPVDGGDIKRFIYG